MAVAQHDDRPHDRAALLVGRGDRCGLGHGRVGHERRLDLERADPVAGGDDHVVRAALEPEVAVGVLPDTVAGSPGVVRAVEEEGRHCRGVDAQLAVVDPELEAGEGEAHRAGADRRADRHAGEGAGLGLPVAVVDLDAGPVAPEPHDLRVERLAGGDRMPQGGQLAQLRSLRDRAVFRRRHAEHVDALTPGDLQPLLRIEAGVVEERRGAHEPRRDEGVARRLRPSRRRGAPGEVALAGAEPVLRLHALAGQVALAVANRLRLARRAGRERDQRRILRPELHRGRGRRGVDRLVRDGEQRPGEAGVAHRVDVAPVGHDDARLHEVHPGAQVLGAQLFGARQRDRADAEAGDHRLHPLRAVPDHGHHDVASRHAELEHPASHSRRPLGELAEAELATRAVPGERQKCPFRGLFRPDNFRCEVHAARVGAEKTLVMNLINMCDLGGNRVASAERLATVPARRGHARRVARGTQVVGANLLNRGAQALSARARQLTPQAYERDCGQAAAT